MKPKIGSWYLIDTTKHRLEDETTTQKGIARIIDLSAISDDKYLAEFGKKIYHGHEGSCRVKGKDGHCWWVLQQSIKRKATPEEIMLETL